MIINRTLNLFIAGDWPMKNISKTLRNLFPVLLLLGLIGCSSDPYLPSAQQTKVVPKWSSFQQAMNDYNQIIPGYTTVHQLAEVGFDPYQTANIKILSYLDILQRFTPNSNIAIDHMDDSVKDCLSWREKCFAYETAVRVDHKKRHGNLFLDLFKFKRVTKQTGWEFNSLVLIKDKTVVYKIWSGQPQIVEYKNRTNPLGFIQGGAKSAITQ